MKRLLLLLALLAPSLALACGPGSGCSSATGLDALACLLFVVILTSPMWLPGLLLLGLVALVLALTRTAKQPARVHLRPGQGPSA
ncbi:MAG: hypothetical protein AMXMBFR34_11020 [Myxococcaceae bacterium]